MEGDESERQSSFKVQDRRRFSATGDAREDIPAERETPAQPAEAARVSSEPPPSAAQNNRIC